MDTINRLVRYRRHLWARRLLSLLGVEIPEQVTIGSGFKLLHKGFGTVIHPETTIGNNVTIFHGVTLGRADAWKPRSESRMEGIVVEDDVVLCVGSRVLCGEGVLRVGRGTILAANAVLTQSTGENEIWAGLPARKVADRQ